MRRQVFPVLGLVVAFLGFGTPSRADDVSFCTSKGYVAYAAYEGVKLDALTHVLRVVRFGPERGIYLAGKLTLSDFATYHMYCIENHVEISGWGRWTNVCTKYVVKIAESEELQTVEFKEYPGMRWQDAATDGQPAEDMSILGPNVPPLPLESSDPEHQYQLLRQQSGRRVTDGLEWHHKTEIVRLSSKGTIV